MKTSNFWHWFTANENKLRTIHDLTDSERTELQFWLSQHLKYYSPKIGHRLIIPPNGIEKPTLSFSICGDPEVRSLILSLMAEAPTYKNWIIAASLTSLADDPDYFDNEYCLNGITLKPSNIKFWGESIDVKKKQFILGIILDFPIDNIDPDLLRQIVRIVLIDTLGESTYNRYIEDFIVHLKIPEDEEIFELYELKMYLEGL